MRPPALVALALGFHPVGVLTPVLSPATTLSSDDDNDPLPESGPHRYSHSILDPKHRVVVMCHVLSPLCLHKIKRKNGAFERCKVRLVVHGQHMKKKDASGSGDFEDSFSSVPHVSGLCLMLVRHSA
jgi:hypothetical protein